MCRYLLFLVISTSYESFKKLEELIMFENCYPSILFWIGLKLSEDVLSEQWAELRRDGESMATPS